MRASGQVPRLMGVLVMGTLLLVACGASRGFPSTTVPSPTEAQPIAGVPATATATASPVLSLASTPTATAGATAIISSTVTPTVSAEQHLSLAAIQMITADQGWATGLATSGPAGQQPTAPVGDVFQTADGGATWQEVSPPGVSPNATDAAFFLDRSNAWIATAMSTTSTITGTYVVYGTIDGGQSWHKGNPFTVAGGGPATLTFADALHGWIMIRLYSATGSEAVEILKSVDGGVNWEPIASTASPGGQSTTGSLPYRCDKSGVTFVDDATGWATGICPGGPLFLYVTHDGGQTWEPQTPPAPPGDPASLFSDCQCAVDPPLFTSTQDGVLAITISQVNQGSYLYATQDGGLTWAVRELPVAQLNGQPDFLNADDGLVTDGERIFATGDGGQTWTQSGTLPISATVSSATYPSGTYLLGSIDFVDINDGWVTDGQHLYSTHDGGQTWSTITPLVVASLPARPTPTEVTLADDGQTLTLQVDDQFLLDLGGQYTWTVSVDNPTIVAHVVGATSVKGAQGVYEALRAGTATLSASGEPICRQAQPPCATPSRQFQLTITVQPG